MFQMYLTKYYIPKESLFMLAGSVLVVLGH